MFETLDICSPKRNHKPQAGWEGFFPYYAGFPESFARSILISRQLHEGAVVLDPWNGSGTTTYVASTLGLHSIGLDLNPVMVLVAKARILPPSEGDSIEPLGKRMLASAQQNLEPLGKDDPLRWWFTAKTATVIRAIEKSLRSHLLGSQSQGSGVVHLEKVSSIAATNYVALFSVCRELAKPFNSSNPTWLRRPKSGERRVSVDRNVIESKFNGRLRSIAKALTKSELDESVGQAQADVRRADTSREVLGKVVDFVLTSPPYCTRIDYTAATRIELAVLHPLLSESAKDLSRQMTGTTRVPEKSPLVKNSWGPTCREFLDKVRTHPAKASNGYYHQTHLDYFAKMSNSLANIAVALRDGGEAVIVVQDSFYKDVHNDLPTIITEMCQEQGLQTGRRADYYLRRSMSGINPRVKAYQRRPGAVESVLCFRKEKPNGGLA
jgi:hypothetical protein